jgi:metal-sulfur cluster biosynthetic enzyme
MSLCEDSVREQLKKVIDPELFVNVVDLGLIYEVSFETLEDESTKVLIDMTRLSGWPSTDWQQQASCRPVRRCQRCRSQNRHGTRLDP